MHYKNSLVFKFMYYECIKPFKKSVLILFLTGIYWSFDLNVRAYMFKLLIDKLSVCSKDEALTTLWPYVISIFALILMRGVVFRIYDYVWLKVKPAMKFSISKFLMGNIMQRSHVFLQKNTSGSLSNQIQDVINNIPLLVNLIVNNFSAHFVAFIISVVMFWFVNIKFAVTLLVWVVSFLCLSVYFSHRAQGLSGKYSKSQFILFGQIVDVLNNIFRVKIFNSHVFEAQRLDTYFNNFAKTSEKRDFCYLVMYSFQALSYAIYQFVCLIILIYGYQDGDVGIGDFILITSINRDIIEYLWVISEDIAKIGEYYGSSKQVLQATITSYVGDDVHVVEPKKIKIKGDITFENITFKYPDQSNNYVFKNLNLKIASKEHVGIVGFSGAGKSSLINLLLRLCDVNAGAVKIDGKNIKHYDFVSLRALFSVITQDLSLFNRSIMENIRYGKLDASDEEVIRAAKKAHAHEFIESFEKGYETQVGQKGANLSAGQRQRIVIACAILRNAPIVIMDEATSALDSITEKNLKASLNELVKNKTLITIVHKLYTLKNMDRIIVLDKGKIVQTGSHDELIKQKGFYQKLLEATVI